MLQFINQVLNFSADVNQNGVVTKSTSTNSISSTTPSNNNNNNCKTKVAGRLGKSPPLLRTAAPRTPRDSAPALRRHLADSQRAVEALAALLNYAAHDVSCLLILVYHFFKLGSKVLFSAKSHYQ